MQIPIEVFRYIFKFSYDLNWIACNVNCYHIFIQLKKFFYKNYKKTIFNHSSFYKLIPIELTIKYSIKYNFKPGIKFHNLNCNRRNIFNYACKYNRLDLVEKYFDRHETYRYKKAIYYASKNNHIHIINFLIKKFPMCNYVLIFYGLKACIQTDNMELINFYFNLLDIKSNFNTLVLQSYINCMSYSIKFNNEKLLSYFLSKINNFEIVPIEIQIWNIGLRRSAKAGNEKLVDFFINKGANDWKGGLISANKGNHTNLITFFKNKNI